MASTLTEYLNSQDVLVQEAALALPHQFSQCTYSLGPLRQAVYLCLTCPEQRGFCSACSVACHTDHNQIELFPKRRFRCDCPTTAITHPCTLHTTIEEQNSSNVYGQNFRGVFCRCGRPYDPKTERETMIQCLACEDWFHESCCNLRERPSSREPSPEVNTDDVEEDNTSETSSSGLPPPLISGQEFESFVCASCTLGIGALRRMAGTPGAMMVVRDDLAHPWRRLGDETHEPSEPDVQNDVEVLSVGDKRPRSTSRAGSPEAKRVRGSGSSPQSSSTPCLAPRANPIAQRIFANSAGPKPSLGTGDVFLTDNFRDRWCRCASCLLSLQENPFLLEEEETYEPPEDPDSGLSLEELGIRALERLPRDRAIDGIHAFNEMRDDLMKFLRPFAQEGRVVGDNDVRSFFEALTKTKDQK